MPWLKLLSAGCLAIPIGFCCVTANGELITFEFAGQINYMEGDLGFLGGSIQIGTPFSGSYTFESTTPDAAYLDPAIGEYAGALTQLSIQVGLHTLSGIGTSNRIAVAHITEGEDTGDAYIMGAGPLQLLARDVSTGIVLLDYEALAISNDSLPLSPPSLDLFDITEFTVIGGPMVSRFYIAGEVTSLLPEPTSLLLMLVGGSAVLRRRRTERTGRRCTIRPLRTRSDGSTSGRPAAVTES